MNARHTTKRTPSNRVPQERKGYFYYDSVEQKSLVEERAQAANRSVSSYILNTLLSSAGDVATAESEVRRLTEEATRWRDDYWAIKKERDALAERVSELERTTQELLLELERARESAEGPTELTYHDVRAWQVLMAHQDESTGEYEPVLERNLIIDLDVVDDPDYIRLLKKRMQRAAEIGIVERVEIHGKTAYKWKGADAVE